MRCYLNLFSNIFFSTFLESLSIFLLIFFQSFHGMYNKPWFWWKKMKNLENEKKWKSVNESKTKIWKIKNTKSMISEYHCFSFLFFSILWFSFLRLLQFNNFSSFSPFFSFFSLCQTYLKLILFHFHFHFQFNSI